MTATSPSNAIPTTVANPETWPQIVGALQQQTGPLPTNDLGTLVAFVSGTVNLLFEAENAKRFDLLQAIFANQVIGQLQNYPGGFLGRAPESLTVSLIGAPPSSGKPVVRIRIEVGAIDAQRQSSVLVQFWDIEIEGSTVMTAETTCANCGAPLPPGVLICEYCHTPTRTTAQMPFLITKIERMS